MKIVIYASIFVLIFSIFVVIGQPAHAEIRKQAVISGTGLPANTLFCIYPFNGCGTTNTTGEFAYNFIWDIGVDAETLVTLQTYSADNEPLQTYTGFKTPYVPDCTKITVALSPSGVLTIEHRIPDGGYDTCIGDAPVADAGLDQIVNSSYDCNEKGIKYKCAKVTLDGSNSASSDGSDLTSYSWSQKKISDEPTVTITGANTPKPIFTSPNLENDKKDVTYSFELIVTDSKGVQSEPSNVSVLVCSKYSEAANDPVGHCDKTRIDVRATHISGALKDKPIWHLFIIFTNSDGEEYLYRAGPGGNNNNPAPYGTILGTDQSYTSSSVDWDPAAPSITVLKGMAAHDKDKCFKQKLDSVTWALIDYEPKLGPNSNSVVRFLLDQCDVPKLKPVTVTPGWNWPFKFWAPL